MPKLDVVLWGATGFTGKLAAQYMARVTAARPELAGLRYGLAGRDASKLERVAEESGCGEVPLLVADGTDDAAVDELAAMLWSQRQHGGGGGGGFGVRGGGSASTPWRLAHAGCSLGRSGLAKGSSTSAAATASCTKIMPTPSTCSLGASAMRLDVLDVAANHATDEV